MLLDTHETDVSDEHECGGSEAEVELGEGILKAVGEVNMILIIRDGPGEEGEDFGGNDTDESDNTEDFADHGFLEGEPESDEEEDYRDDADRVPEIGEAADLADASDAAVLAGDHGDEAD